MTRDAVAIDEGTLGGNWRERTLRVLRRRPARASRGRLDLAGGRQCNCQCQPTGG